MTWREFPKWINAPDGPVIVHSIEEERAITGIAPVAAEIPETSEPTAALLTVEEQHLSRSPWQAGMPRRTKQDEADWRVWRHDRILTQQRDRRARLRRIDYYVSPEAAEIIDRLRAPSASGDASSILNRIVVEWAARFRNKMRLSRNTRHHH